MLLARRGCRVLLVDRASFPSDTLSCHFLHQPGVASLERWALLPEVVRSGCPPMDSQVLDLGPFALHGRVRPNAAGLAERIRANAAVPAAHRRWTCPGFEATGAGSFARRSHPP